MALWVRCAAALAARTIPLCYAPASHVPATASVRERVQGRFGWNRFVAGRGCGRSLMDPNGEVQPFQSPEQEASTIHIQALVRGSMALKRHARQRSAAIKIQARVRGRATRKGYLARKREALSKALFSMFSGWGSPVRGSVNAGDNYRISPNDASWAERLRDRWLSKMASVEHELIILAAILGIALVAALVGVIVLFFPLNLGVSMGAMSEIVVAACNESQYNASWILERGTDSMPPRVDHPSVPTLDSWTTQGLDGGKYVSYYCTPAQWWFNICCKVRHASNVRVTTVAPSLQSSAPAHAATRASISRVLQYLSFYFGYVNMLPVPWTFSILVHSYFNRPGYDDAPPEVGADFYGRPTESMWFHLPLRSRRRIAMLNLIALLLQIPDCLFQCAMMRQPRPRAPRLSSCGGLRGWVRGGTAALGGEWGCARGRAACVPSHPPPMRAATPTAPPSPCGRTTPAERARCLDSRAAAAACPNARAAHASSGSTSRYRSGRASC